jgi:predicted CXXCH cytochrome family protein
VATPYEVITCTACHEPHDAANPHQLRTSAPVTLMDKKTTITTNTAGMGILCMNCHMSRRDATNYVEVTPGSSRFGPHHGPQADMLAGANAMNYGKVIPSSAHREVVEDSCVTCHMQEVASTSPAFTQVGGHTFKPKWDSGTNVVEMTEACVQCHGEIEDFDFKRQDYDGNGVVEGVQTEVRGLLSRLALLLPPVGVAKTNHSPSNISINSSWTRPQLRAGYNYLFVVEDGSYGIHNLSYAVGLLKASIADLTGDANMDGLPDWWQIQYFGTITNPQAAPYATPANDGVPNWLKYSSGLNPLVAGVPMTGGYVFGPSVVNPLGTNAVTIYTAAEINFNTQVGVTYQIQSIGKMGDAWQNVGGSIAGNGGSMRYLTQTRNPSQQFFRVVHTP